VRPAATGDLQRAPGARAALLSAAPAARWRVAVLVARTRMLAVTAARVLGPALQTQRSGAPVGKPVLGG
jgi:hypothetical protein